MASGLTVTGSNVTIRGLDIGGFSPGAGILISGTGATGNVIENNDIGTDPTGSLALPNEYGIQIVGGASDNLVGGSTSSAGNVIAFNIGVGVVVEGDNSTGDQITGNEIFGNENVSALQFDGSSYVSLPNGLIGALGQSQTLEASFETSSGGVIFGYQSASPENYPYGGDVPSLYVGTDGKLYGGSYDSDTGSIVQVTSSEPVNDGLWHTVALSSTSPHKQSPFTWTGSYWDRSQGRHGTIPTALTRSGPDIPTTGRQHPADGMASMVRSPTSPFGV